MPNYCFWVTKLSCAILSSADSAGMVITACEVRRGPYGTIWNRLASTSILQLHYAVESVNLELMVSFDSFFRNNKYNNCLIFFHSEYDLRDFAGCF